MWDTLQKLEYRANAGLTKAKAELEQRLSDRMALPLPGIHGEKLYLTGVEQLKNRCVELNQLYDKLPEHRGFKDTILLDAWSSATIEGARTTVAKVKQSFDNPKTKDDKMVVNTIAGCNYAYQHPITGHNIRKLWEMVVEDVCENQQHQGSLYRDGMVYIGSHNRIIHVPAAPEQLPERMDALFSFQETETDPLLMSFVAHFYFVYIHPFCDGNGRLARILNASQLYHSGYRKMKNLPLSSAINDQLSGYYGSLNDSEQPLLDNGHSWLDLSPFVSYMLDAFERCLIDAGLSQNTLTPSESKLLERMNKAGLHAEITVKKAMGILNLSESTTRKTLNQLVTKGYLRVDTSHVPFIFRLQKHIP